MLTQTRQEEILRLLQAEGSVTLRDLKERLRASESTIRRDLNQLAKQGRLQKVFGGAVALEDSAPQDVDIARREEEHIAEKQTIARYAASLVQDNDFVFLDAGTTTGCMLDWLHASCATFVTNAPSHAQRLARMGRDVILIGGQVKDSTEAAVGAVACEQLQQYNFTIGFFGVNGVSMQAALTTPDPDEAQVKRCAIARARTRYILCDYSKFHKISPVTFCALEDAVILTDHIPSEVFRSLPSIVDLSQEAE